MSTEKENVAKGSVQPTAKRNRRGISNQTKATSQLRFHEKDAANNGLFIGHLEEVRVDWSTNSDGKQFTGESVPRLTFHFASNHVNASEQRHVYQTLNPIESNVNTIPGGSEDWKVNNVFNWIKHVLDIYYLKGRELREEEEEALALPFEDFDDNGDYVVVEQSDVIAGYAFIFNNAAAMLNGSFKDLADGETPKPCYKTADGKVIPTWIKLLRHKKVKNQWRNINQNGELGFDTFIGNGVIELVKKDQMPSVLRIDLAKESITPKEVKQAPSIGAPGMTPNMGGVMANPNISMGDAMNMGAFADAGDDMPF